MQHMNYSIITFGCQMNENDSERIAGQLKAMGLSESSQLDDADIIVINTCCVRESAEKKIYGKIGDLKRLKTANPDLIIAVAGCMAQKDRDKLFKKAPHIDLVIGTHNVHQLADLLSDFEKSRGKVLAVWEQAERLTPEVPSIRKNKIAAWVPIMYGCNNFCSYCIVPYVRGREQSRSADEIVAEIRELATLGYKEVTLLGQNVNSYGKDSENFPDFADLLAIVDGIDSIKRIRYMTSHPRDMNEKVIAAVTDGQKICEHFHLPVQAGSDEILARMNRGYTTEYYRHLVAAIRSAIPHASLTTDIIVGFPGETEELFAETLKFVKTTCFDAAYTFLYSERSGTPAAKMPEQVPIAVKKERLNRLMQVQNENSLAVNQKLLNQTLEVLIEGNSKNDTNKMMGRTRTNKIVIWDKTGLESVGQLAEILILTAQTWVLKGRLLRLL